MDQENVVNEPTELELAVQGYMSTGSRQDKDKVVKIGQELIKYYAGVYSPGKVDDRLKKAASDGFTRALKSFDPARKMHFTTYATHCIISEIRQELRSRKLFKIPDWLQRLQDDVVKATEELAKEDNPLPTLQEIAEKVNVSEEGIVEAMQAGSVSLKDLDLRSLKSLRRETFKMPIEDAIMIRKSLDRLSDIQKKVLSLININLRELVLAMEEEELALTETQAGYIRMVEVEKDNKDTDHETNSYKVAFPEHFVEDEVERYFEVLSDEYGLKLSSLKFKGPFKPVDNNYESICLGLKMEGRYRCLVHLLNHLRNEERAIQVGRVSTTRNERIPARISTKLELKTYFRQQH